MLKISRVYLALSKSSLTSIPRIKSSYTPSKRPLHMKEKGAVPSSSLLISSAKLLAQSCPVPAARDGSACFDSATREQLASVGWAGKDTWWKCAELSPALPGSVKTAWASHSGIKNRAQYTQKCLPCLLSTRSELCETEVKCIAGSSVGC